MNFRSSLCRSDSKVKNPVNRNNNGARSSLQNENPVFRRQRSSSLDFRARGSGSASKPRSSSEERKSGVFSGWNSSRKSSINFNEGKAIKESRPLSDKTYQKTKLLELIDFLNNSGFPYPLTLAKMMQPSKKDFENIFQFLVRFSEPSFEVKKLEEDAPRMLKNLCYPFIPNKSAFMYVARTNWPSLFGVLLFLMDLAKFSSNIDESLLLSSWESERPEEHAIVLEYIFRSYFQRSDNGEEEKQIFTKIIKARMPYNIEDLQRKKEILEEELEKIQNAVEANNVLKDKSQQLDDKLKEYEKYFVDMREHKKKKEDLCQKSLEEVTQRESELKSLQEILAEKQALYDAQGYDGKKQMSYIEHQKKELMEKLESKKSIFRGLQNECGEAEIQHRQSIDNGMALCETFNDLYVKVTETANSIFDPLRNIKDPQIKNLCSNLTFDFPDCKMQPNQKCLVQWSNTRKSSLEEVKQKVDSAILIFKGLSATQNQKLHEILMKKSELAVNLKMASSEETQKERDLTSKEKQAVEDVKAVEAECNEMIKELEMLQAERIKYEEEYAASREELNKLESIKREKQKMLDDYLIEQKKLFSTWLKDIDEAKQLCQENGEEMFAALEKELKKL